jgi:alpha-2-macroglobulin
MRTQRFLLALSLALLSLLPLFACSASSAASNDAQANAALPGDVRAAMVAGDWKAARKLLDERLEKAPDQSDLWLFLKGLTFQFDGQSTDALATFTDLETRFGASPLAVKSRFQRAEILRASGQQAGAEQIFESEALRLRSGARQSELAKVYLDLADGLSTPPATATAEAPRIDYAAAYSLYAAVLELAAPPKDRARAMLRMGLCLEQQHKDTECVADCERFLAAFDPAHAAPEAGAERAPTAAGLEDVLDVRLRLGRMQFIRKGQGAVARRTFEDMAEDVRAARGGQGPYARALTALDVAGLERIVRLEGDARLLSAETFQNSVHNDNALAVAALRRFLASSPGHPRSAYALHEIAKIEDQSGHTEQSLHALDEVIGLAVSAALTPKERDEDTQMRVTSQMEKGRRLLDQKRFDAAAAAFREYAQRYPSGSEWSNAQTLLVECEFRRAQDHRDNERFAEARAAWSVFLMAHPLDARAADVSYQIGECFEAEALSALKKGAERGATDDGKARAIELRKSAVLEWQRLAQRFQGTDTASRAIFGAGDLLERELGDLQAAVEAYRQCTFGPSAGDAALRLATMTRPSLALASQGVWRTGGKPRVIAQVRNLEKLRVQVYKLDLETYFRKHRTYAGIEKLDLDLIAADVTSEVTVANYLRYAQIEQPIDLPFDAPGTWVVAVTGGEFRATTLVVASALDVIVKSSAHEVFVFAEDVVRGEPAAKARVLVALQEEKGPRVIELVTGADGIARESLTEPFTQGQAAVLALRGGDVATVGLSLQGLELGVPLVAKGLVYTDRPAYRPGQTVNWRAIVRGVLDGRETIDAGGTCTVEVLDPAGRSLVRQSATSSAFGTLNDTLALDAAASPGAYRIVVHSGKGGDFTGTFQVQTYQLQKMDIDFTFARPVVQRGEKVELEIKAEYYYGEPVADAPLRVNLPDGTQSQLRTDAQGIAKLAFDTRDVTVDGLLKFTATLLEEGVERTGTVHLAQREYSAKLTSPRDVVLAGDSFEAELATRGPDDEPLSRTLTFTLLRRESSPLGKWSEIEVSHQDVVTDARTGLARIPVKLERGGQHVLRVEALDRFGSPITSEVAVLASGDDDDVRLRLIASDGEIEVGSKAHVQVVNRSGAGLALLTLEGDAVIEHRLLRLEPGTSTVDLDLDSRAFPRVWVAIARMDKERLYEHSVSLAIVRRLDVTIEALEKTYEPGARAKLRVSAKDQLGRPAQAEFSIAVVDESLFDLYPDTTPKLASVFERAPRRTLGVRTSSSCTFAYTGYTAKIAQEVLNEERAKQEQAEWQSRRGELQAGLNYLVSQDAAKAPATQTVNALEKNKADKDGEAEGGTAIGVGQRGSAKGRAGGGMGAGRPRAAEVEALPETETAYWTATLTTGADGKATAEFELPGQSTRWRATCRGVGLETLVGEATTSFQSRADLFLELRTPPQLVEGDRPRFIARVHNSTGATGKLELKLHVTSGDHITTIPVSIDLGASTIVEHVFEAIEALPGRVSLHLEATGSFGGRERKLATEADIDVRPLGIEGAATAAGKLTSDATLSLELDPSRKWASRTLEIQMGPSLQRLLVAEALGESNAIALRAGCLPPTTIADSAAELYGITHVLELNGAAGAAAPTDQPRLLARAQSRITELVVSQRADGGWSWSRGQHVSAHVETSCLALAALARAAKTGLVVPTRTLELAIVYLNSGFRSASQQDDEQKAEIVWALAVQGSGDFAAANRLHRARGSLSPAALAYTALALVEMDRAPMAAEVAEALVQRLGADQKRALTEGNTPWNTSPTEMTALAAYTLGRALPSSPALSPLVDALLGARPWAPARARGFALSALAWHVQHTTPAQARSNVEVLVEGQPARKQELSPDQPGAAFTFTLPDTVASKVRVDLKLTGGGQPHYVAVLRGFSTDTSAREGSTLRILKQHEIAAPPVFRGREIPTGFGATRDVQPWTNTVQHLPLGAVATYRVEMRAPPRTKENNASFDYLVLEVPLPAGTRLLEDGMSNWNAGWRVENGKLFVELGQQQWDDSIEFRLLGTLPGHYRVPPAILRSAYDPARFAIGVAHDFEVLGRGEASTDKYEPTPDELLNLGQATFAAGERDRARALLEKLYTSYGPQLTDTALRSAAETLLYLSIEREEAPAIVRYFEVLKEKNPDLTLSFEQILAVGAAYRKLDEHERALLIFKATIEETFGKDLKVVGALDAAKDADAALRTFARLLRDYPDFPGMLEAQLALSGRLLKLAPKAGEDATLRRAGRDRAALTLEGVQILQRFLSMHPRDPLAPEAGLNLVNAFLSIEDYERTAKVGRELAEVYVKSNCADSCLYAAAVADWYRGEDKSAEMHLSAIAEATWKDASGVEKHSPNRDLALYILAQIHHARQEFGTAAGYYERVANLFADARESLLALHEKTIALPEITSARPGERIEIALSYRNVARAEILVYPVDLMTLYLREKTLAHVAGVELAGISPTLRLSVELAKDAQLRSRDEKVALDLKEPGAYLVIARGDE